MRKYEQIGVMIPDVYLPRPDVDLRKWAVIACDQFTSQPEYWQQVSELVGDDPSTYHLILPEVYLGKPEETARLTSIQQTMTRYLNEGILQQQEGLIYVERRVAGKMRKGLLLCLDLEQYDYNKGSSSLIRATEGTILDRLPPRIRIRENALLELPHILVLIDDPDHNVIEPLANHKSNMERLYRIDLMLGSGQIEGWRLADKATEVGVMRNLVELTNPDTFQKKYNFDTDKPVLLFAVGDGNHSLATAKANWEKIKPQVGMDHPARYALVEIENVHDDGLEFKPIHRVVFKVTCDLQKELQKFFPAGCSIQPVADLSSMKAAVAESTSDHQRFGMISADGLSIVELSAPPLTLPVGNLQAFLDECLKTKGAESIDYVHGEDIVLNLGSQPGNYGFYLPAMPKSDLFRTVILDGALPRKTFSMGEAIEKRFYIEARKIK